MQINKAEELSEQMINHILPFCVWDNCANKGGSNYPGSTVNKILFHFSKWFAGAIVSFVIILINFLSAALIIVERKENNL